ncbi:9625_t:CDS:2 [Funneliformis geosporum]|nr:9625_t:CDS:2 [Funneliformis geosporum]
MDSNVETKSHRLSIVINVMWKSNLQASPPTRREREYDPGKGALEIRQLYRDLPIDTSINVETRYANQTSLNLNTNRGSDTTLRQLPHEISSDKVLYDREITDFLEVMVFLIKSTLSQDTAGAIYIWSRMESSMEYVGLDLREALINYLFHQDNICYIIEETHEIISSQQLNSIKKLVNGQIQSRLLNWY